MKTSHKTYYRDEKRYHISWLIMWLSIGLVSGVILSLFVAGFAGVGLVFVAIILFITALRKKNSLSIVLAFLAGMSLGLYRGASQLDSQTIYSSYFGETVVVVGSVAEDPSYDVDGDIRLRLRDVVVNGHQSGGELWVSSPENKVVKRSDVVSIEGELRDGFGTIPAAIYRAEIRQVVSGEDVDTARRLRDGFADGIRAGIKEPEASLGAGFLLGQKTALPEKLDQELRLLGLTHVVVASGYNLTILVRFARRFFMRISRFSALVLSGGLVYCFALVTGWSPSMSRAGLIATLSLLAWYYGRKFHPLVLLSLSAAVTVFIKPSYAWGDIGWLLSFASFVGVIMLAPLINVYFWGDKKPGNVRQVVIETTSAQLLTLPLVMYVFGYYSPLALLANLTILPLIPLTMLATFISGIVGLLSPSAAVIIGWPAQIIMSYMTFIIDFLARSPLASNEVSVGIGVVMAGYLLVVSVIIFLWRRTGYSFRNYNIIE